jgi:hypothetical protein
MRLPLPDRVLARLVAAVEASQQHADPALLELFTAVWRRGRDAVWSVRDLRMDGLVRDEAAWRTGQALRALHAQQGGHCAGFVLHEAGGDRYGNLWRLTRM